MFRESPQAFPLYIGNGVGVPAFGYHLKPSINAIRGPGDTRKVCSRRILTCPVKGTVNADFHVKREKPADPLAGNVGVSAALLSAEAYILYSISLAAAEQRPLARSSALALNSVCRDLQHC